MKKIAAILEKRMLGIEIVDEETGLPDTYIEIKWKHFATLILLIIAMAMLQGCSPARNTNGEYWKATQVLHRVTVRDTTIQGIRIGGWMFPPKSVEYIMWKRMDSLQRRIEALENPQYNESIKLGTTHGN